MSVRIRLRRVGRKKQPSYRLVVADSRTPRDGAYIDTVGFYNPRTQPAQLTLDIEKVDAWLAQGASASDTVASLIRKARRGGDAKVALLSPEELSKRREPAAVAPAPATAAATPKKGKAKAAAAEAAAPEASAREAVAPEATAPEATAPEPAAPEASETTPVGDEPGGVEPAEPGTSRGEAGEATGEGSEKPQA
jgi:small subunit ribosomal protein S16